MAQIKEYGTRFGFLSANVLKIFACVFMFVDHFGLMIYPDEVAYRAVGRLAFPIFAYFIAEGCRYTKRRFKHFMLILLMGVAFFVFFYFFANMLYASIFLTFSVAILLIYLCDFLKKFSFTDFKAWRLAVSIFVLVIALAAAYLLSTLLLFDYGYIGMITPFLISLLDFKDIKVPKKIEWLDSYPVRLAVLAVMMVLLIFKNSVWHISLLGISFPMQACGLLAIPLLAFYNGKPGNKRLKPFFYIYYPAHLCLIMVISIIIDAL